MSSIIWLKRKVFLIIHRNIVNNSMVFLCVAVVAVQYVLTFMCLCVSYTHINGFQWNELRAMIIMRTAAHFDTTYIHTEWVCMSSARDNKVYKRNQQQCNQPTNQLPKRTFRCVFFQRLVSYRIVFLVVLFSFFFHLFNVLAPSTLLTTCFECGFIVCICCRSRWHCGRCGLLWIFMAAIVILFLHCIPIDKAIIAIIAQKFVIFQRTHFESFAYHIDHIWATSWLIDIDYQPRICTTNEAYIFALTFHRFGYWVRIFWWILLAFVWRHFYLVWFRFWRNFSFATNFFLLKYCDFFLKIYWRFTHSLTLYRFYCTFLSREAKKCLAIYFVYLLSLLQYFYSSCQIINYFRGFFCLQIFKIIFKTFY